MFGKKGEKPAEKALENPSPEPYMGVMQTRYLFVKYDEPSCSLFIHVEGKETVSTEHSPEYNGITVEFDAQRNRIGYLIPLQRFKKHDAMKLPIWTEVGRENLSILYSIPFTPKISISKRFPFFSFIDEIMAIFGFGKYELGSGPFSIGLDPDKYDFSSDDFGDVLVGQTPLLATLDTKNVIYDYTADDISLLIPGWRLKFGYLKDEELDQLVP